MSNQSIQGIPSWFKEIEKTLLTDQVNNVFSKLDLKIIDLVTDLITFFGVINKNKVKSTLKWRFNHYGIDPETGYLRLENILGIYLKCMKKYKTTKTSGTIINEVTVILERSKLYDHLSMFSDIWTYALQDMSKYILAWSTPLQESQLRGCYSFDWIKLKIDTDELHYQKIIMNLFEIKSKEKHEIFCKTDEFLLYKRAAIKANDKEISWAAYLYKWLTENDSSSALLEAMIESTFFKIFIKQNPLSARRRNAPTHNLSEPIPHKNIIKQSPLTTKSKSINEIRRIEPCNLQPKVYSFKNDLFQATISHLCDHPKSLLPKSTYFKGHLLKLFESSLPIDRSDHARQTIMYYIDYLNKNFLPIPQETEACSKNGLELLNGLISDTEASIYNFLHALLHYFNCFNQSTDDEAKNFLFKSIYLINITDRKKYDTQTKEFHNKIKFSRQKLKIDSSLIKFVNNHSLERRQWGHIFLRFSRSNLEDKPCPYLDPEAHFNLIEKIEELTGLLPDEIVYDLLYFQMVFKTASIFEVLTRFSDLRNLIIKEHLEKISLSADLFDELNKQTNLFLDQFTNIVSKDIRLLNDRANMLAAIVGDTAFLLSMTTYPKASVSFIELIPLKTKGQQLIFKKKVLNEIIDFYRPLHPKFNLGPTWVVRWEFNQKLEMFEMIVILTNRVKNNVSCSFRLPIKIPTQDEQKSTHFCNLIASSVDGLGQEALSEDENRKINELGLTIKKSSLRNSIKGTPQKKFDHFMESSPLLKYEFEKLNTNEKELQINEMKAELLDFVKLLRTSFLQSFYFVLDPEGMSDKLSNSCISVIFPRSEGFYFSSSLSLYIPDMSDQDQSKVHIKNCDYQEKFREIYHEVYWENEKTPRNYQDKFLLKFYAENSTQELPVSVQIENLYMNDKPVSQFSDFTLKFSEAKINLTKKDIDIGEFLFEESEVEVPPDASNTESKTSQEEIPPILSEYLPDNVDKIVQITMRLQPSAIIDEELYTLTIKRPLFEDEKDFTDFLLWQLAVACNDNKEAWLWQF